LAFRGLWRFAGAKPPYEIYQFANVCRAVARVGRNSDSVLRRMRSAPITKLFFMKMDVRFMKANTYHLNHKPEAIMRKQTSDLSLSSFKKIVRRNTLSLLRPMQAALFFRVFSTILKRQP
jgi:hypothetical protein